MEELAKRLNVDYSKRYRKESLKPDRVLKSGMVIPFSGETLAYWGVYEVRVTRIVCKVPSSSVRWTMWGPTDIPFVLRLNTYWLLVGSYLK